MLQHNATVAVIKDDGHMQYFFQVWAVWVADAPGFWLVSQNRVLPAQPDAEAPPLPYGTAAG